MGDAAADKALIEQFWADLYRRDWDAVAGYFTADAHYVDVCAGEEGAFGPDEIIARLRLGLEPLEAYIHHPRLMVAGDSTVVTEHAEEWHWHTGERITFPFVSVQELRDGKITRWWDYWDLQTLLAAAPAWWVERVAGGYK
ncbi:MAG: nuclear transport factor 2 family protein [Acidimicrobiia bacterium]